ncbi:bone morphogenetic protein 1-like isoform X2 [Centruroides sculpturatus]|uniref:bone morphogenetic protein 1-like isoform X2 n=1 Tax=Centruroides sculpturatus TaxID=218467 RepID=UPI000C6E604A|nr:bone morphogenetic protein 1-like isoform X2 [Centruroides sculpturatus]
MNEHFNRTMKILISLFVLTILSIVFTSAKSLSDVKQKKDTENFHKSKIWKRVATSDPNKLWDDGVIPYEINGNFSANYIKFILYAMDIWESKTCIKFVPAEPIHKFRVTFTNVGDCGCCSNLGKIKEKQPIILHEKQCTWVSTILHEMAHTMGFYHEQSRPDRDNFIKVLYENIEEKRKYQFRKISSDEADTLGFSYDFNSIMHYSSFTSSGKEGMKALNKSISLKKPNKKLSKTDIAAANKLYKCPDCYVKLKKKMDKIDMSANSLTSRKGSCQWFIKRDPGEFIEFYVEKVDIPESDGCSSNYLLLQDGYTSKSPVIDRVCGIRQKRTYYKTERNNLLITYKSFPNYKSEEFSLVYRVVCNGTIKGDYGRLQNPNYDHPYPYDSICQWVLAVPIGHVVLSFETFYINDDEDCQSDYIEVIDGDIDSGKVILDKVCGNKVPDVIVSTNNKLTVTYVSKNKNKKNKFSANFIEDIDECQLPDRGGCNDICVNTIGSYRCECSPDRIWVNRTNNCEKFLNSCGGTVQKGERIVIESPSYPNPYPSNIECTWDILENNFRMTIFNVDINGSKDNCLDEIIVQTQNSKKVYCGSGVNYGLKLSHASGVQVRFISKENTDKTGFQILLEPL